MTHAPCQVAICTAAWPTLPLTPNTRTVSPLFGTPARRKPSIAVTKGTPMPAASSQDTAFGFSTTASASMTRSSGPRVSIWRSTTGAIAAAFSALALRRTQRTSTALVSAGDMENTRDFSPALSPLRGIKSILRPLVVEPLGLAERALQRGRCNHPHPGADADGVLDMGRDTVSMVDEPATIPALGSRLRDDGQLVHAAFAGELEDEVAAAPIGREQDFLDLGREQIDTAQDDHVVRAPGDLLHPPHPGASRAWQQPRQVAGAIADHRKGFLGQRGEHQFALLAVRQHRAGLGIDHFGIEMILPDVQAILGLDAFLRDAGADHFGEAVDVGRIHVKRIFDLAAHRIGPGLRAKNADLERALAGVKFLALELIQDRQHVARRHRDDVGPEIVDELDLPLGHAARDRHHGAAELFGAVMHAEPAGEEAVAIGVVNDHAGAATGGADRPRHHLRPGVDVALGIADHDRLARRP